MSMWLATTKADVNFLAAIGDDLLGQWISEQLSAGNLDASNLQVISGSRSGTCIILVGQDGQRTMLPDPAANLHFKLGQSETELINSSSVVVMSTYSFLRPETRELALDVAKLVQNNSARFVLDAASSAPIAEVGVDLVRQYLLQADLILANEDEFALLDHPDWTSQVSDLVVKQGPLGAKWLRFGQEVCQVAAKEVQVLDTTGAGDSFLAGLISVLVEHSDWFAISDADRSAALERGAQIAAINISKVGAGP
jgi:sugar/nucleoside kinase (ribokinase family)